MIWFLGAWQSPACGLWINSLIKCTSILGCNLLYFLSLNWLRDPILTKYDRQRVLWLSWLAQCWNGVSPLTKLVRHSDQAWALPILVDTASGSCRRRYIFVKFIMPRCSSIHLVPTTFYLGLSSPLTILTSGTLALHSRFGTSERTILRLQKEHSLIPLVWKSPRKKHTRAGGSELTDART